MTDYRIRYGGRVEEVVVVPKAQYVEMEYESEWLHRVLLCRFAPDMGVRVGAALYGRRFVDDQS